MPSPKRSTDTSGASTRRSERGFLARFAGGIVSGISWLVVTAALGAVIAGGALLYIINRAGDDLPDYSHLANYVPPNVTRIHAGDGRILAEYAHEKRVFVPIDAIPRPVKDAFVAAEDKNFYSHIGVDPVGIIRAAVDNIQRLQQNLRPQGASTITQQVAKNFLLTNEVSLDRKIKEAILALRMEKAFSKDHILELYLNEIFLGHRSYGVAAAALNYFDKALEELTLSEAAFLAGLPKAPSRYDPATNYGEAVARRDYVIGRMLDDGYITRADADAARAEDIVLRSRKETETVSADFFTEEVRRTLVDTFGEDGFYGGGLSVRTTVDPVMQAFADSALRRGLSAYDRRQGYRGPLGHIDPAAPDWSGELAEFDPGFEPGSWKIALVLDSGADKARLALAEGGEIEIFTRHLSWARRLDANGDLGPDVTRADRVLEPGDVVIVTLVEPEDEDGDGQADGKAVWGLRQRPNIEGGLVALDPHTGRVLAMSGGFSFRQSKFNRATQANRQPGSAFKPFVYLAALESGFTPASIILDAPLVIDQGEGLPKWKPANYGDRFYGPSTLRLGIEKSRNLMTVRLAQQIGMGRVIDVATRFGVDRGLGNNLASALGSNEVDLLSLTTAYAMLVNGGRKIDPSLVERIQDRYGRTVLARDPRICEACRKLVWDGEPPPVIPDGRPLIADPREAYQMVHIMEGVIDHGTGVRAGKIGKPLAGKTGTTNDSRDAWFVGFSPDLAVGVYAGFDIPAPLGRRETGASIALPIWTEFMGKALAGKPATPFRTPPGVRLVRIDADTGLLPGPTTRRVIAEAFLPGTEPVTKTPAEAAAPLIVENDSDTPAPVRAVPVAPASSGLY
ncbi:MAG: penicillin-binding protein 1A [Geminicoccaceae bacterium]|nr:penicillin-binding protein 1A [Geminicoccaceae bacterium]